MQAQLHIKSEGFFWNNNGVDANLSNNMYDVGTVYLKYLIF